MITAENLSKGYGARTLFDEASFRINPGEKVGLVGRNGHGKTTLVRIITGEETPDDGGITFPKRYSVGYLKQHLDFTAPTVLEEGARGLKEDDKLDVWKVEKILSGLGFSEEDMQRHPSYFSGGYQVRLNLAKVLVSEPNMLLLDEPTNYLDITSIRWLEGFLNDWKGELILITHDRGFMDRVITHTLGIHRNKIRKIEGDTGKLYEQLAKEEEIYEKTRLNEEQKRKDMERFITRFRAKARLANLVQSRVKALNRMEKKEKLDEIKELDFSFRYKDYKGKEALSAKNITFGYKPDEPLIKDFSITIGNGERVGIIGKNGKGKTTLLKILAGVLNPDSGEVLYNNGIEKGFYEQTNVKSLDERKSIEEELMDSHTDVERQLARDIAGTMMFEGEEALKKIGVLSGGEKSRVMLGKLLATPLNFLLLDEPTNHLDMQSSDSLLEALDAFRGTMLLITHNEMFLHALVDRLIVFKNGEVTVFEGTYSDFLEKEGWGDEDDEPAKETKPTGSDGKLTKKELRRRRSEVITERNNVLKPLQKSVEELESRISALENDVERINAEMIEASEKGEGERIGELSKALNSTEAEIEELFDTLAEDTERLETLSEEYEARLAELGD
ncbi:ABC-F family ATP-binding cassette domain-containing protein [Limisalsivibrio acetivorans]|uniref:ABC-F family ATP-binding cassette domain-containing protein n=1 Tax=Limisalsivibrio acetivorans TaxID=1304888 RepID=UPI0003B6186B|nr:ABC-F family ATP-binding cassette domain-containing protein [Limisalsivibrio acetivorans]